MRIAIDCEFSFDVDNEYYLVCACATQEDGQTRKFWRTQRDELRQYILDHKSDIWLAHNVETAEGYMCQDLGLRPTKYRWHDTMLMSRVVHNTCSLKHAKHGLADCLAREGVHVLDQEQKHADQSICIWRQDCTWEAHLAKLEACKEHLMEYCLQDTAYLIALDDKLDAKLSKHMSPLSKIDKDEMLEPERRACYYGFLAAICSEISWRGIPLDADRVAAIKRNAPHAIASTQQAFVAKYPGTYRQDAKKLTRDVDKCREYAKAVYGDKAPMTDSGKVSLASDFTKSHKDMDDFLGDYYTMDKRCRALASFSKKDREKNWLGMFLPKRGIIRSRINPLGAATGRCGSKPSTGFVYTMGKPFRGLVSPKQGKVLVELDYHSEEIGCQAYLTGDKTMSKMYEGPDYYTTIAQSIDPSVKDKHDPRRKKYKVISLMSNYGCGSAHLAEIAKVPKAEADKILRHLKHMFATYWRYVDKMTHKCVDDSCTLWFADGWRIKYSGGKVTTLGNWPFQGVGAYILRIMLVELYKADIHVVAPVHDAIVIEADEDTWRDTAARAVQIMQDVSKRALGTQIDVGDPEVTFNDIINCHSELSTREQYATEPHNKYYEQFMEYIADARETVSPDTDNLWVDEEIVSKT